MRPQPEEIRPMSGVWLVLGMVTLMVIGAWTVVSRVVAWAARLW